MYVGVGRSIVLLPLVARDNRCVYMFVCCVAAVGCLAVEC